MSIEAAKAFMERMKSDEEFAKGVMAEKTAEAVIALAHGEGFDFTMEEIKQERNKLSDNELDAVGGGMSSGLCSPLGGCLSGANLIYPSEINKRCYGMFHHG